MFEPVKVAFGRYVERYFSGLVATTKPMQEYVQRPVSRAIGWAPGRMVDYAEEMLSEWQRSGSSIEDQEVSQGFGQMPLIAVAFAKDWTPSEEIQVMEPSFVQFDNDDKSRVFKLQSTTGDIRAQVAFFAEDEPTARSMAAQFLMYAKRRFSRDIAAGFCFAGLSQSWPARIKADGAMASNVQVETKNTTILVVDLDVMCTIPFYSAPGINDQHDGQGAPGTDDPPGFLLYEHPNRAEPDPAPKAETLVSVTELADWKGG